MTRRPALTSLSVAALLLAAVLTGCSEDDPALCSSVDDLRTSVDKVTEVDIDEGTMATLQSDVDQVQSDLQKVRSDAADEYATQIDAVDQAASSVATSLEAATTTPSAAAVADVSTAAQALGAALRDLSDAVESTC